MSPTAARYAHILVYLVAVVWYIAAYGERPDCEDHADLHIVADLVNKEQT